MPRWIDGHWLSSDGLRLHYRAYPGPKERPTILCIPGLTRNARDFEGVAGRLSGDWRLICVDLRGRGESAYAPDPSSYVPLTYLHDLEALIAQLRLRRFVFVGTSLGGLLAMLLAMTDPGRIAGALINDVGPVIEAHGLDRIRSYVGKPQSWANWEESARFFSETQRDVYPAWGPGDWLVYAKRLCKAAPDGRIVLDYDMRIAEPLRVAAAQTVDLWPAFRALGGAPLALVHGERSDLLGAATVTAMKEAVPAMDIVTVPGVGHAPTLDEPEAQEAITRLLARVAAG